MVISEVRPAPPKPAFLRSKVIYSVCVLSILRLSLPWGIAAVSSTSFEQEGMPFVTTSESRFEMLLTGWRLKRTLAIWE